MSIPTQMSLVGFAASAPELHLTKDGAECCRLRAGVERRRKEVDGSYMRLDATFHDMVAFDSTARETYARFRKGDLSVASGYIHEYEVERPVEPSMIEEELVALEIGHPVDRTAYDVQRRHLAAAPLPAQAPPGTAIGF